MTPAPRDRTQGFGPWRLLHYVSSSWNLRNRGRRILLTLLRRFLPVLRWRGTAYVWRWADVRSVLARPAEFSVRIFGMRMADTTGITFLGMNPSQQYELESGALRAALGVPDVRPRARGPQDLGRLTSVRRFGAELSHRQITDALKRTNEIDVVTDLADVVPLHFAREFFGLPEPDPEHPKIQEWFRAISYYVFGPKNYDWAVPAQHAGRAAAEHFRRLVRDRHDALAAGVATPDDVLGRLIRAKTSPSGLDDDAIARSLSFISGAIMPTSWLFIEAVDRLMRLGPRQRQHLHECAVQNDAAAVRAYVIEAARFFPFPFFILRYAERDSEIAGRKIARGSTINLVIGSATLDSRGIRRAGRFVAGRPESEYMLFGHDVHLCQGKDIAEELMTQMALALFSRVNLHRAPGLQGYIRYGPKGSIPYGPYPRSLILLADA
jgi:cytochrome P450